MRNLVRLLGLGLLLAVVVPEAPGQGKGKGSVKDWEQTVDRAIDYLRKTQDEDGSWGGPSKMGVTGLVVAGVLNTRRIDTRDPMMEKALKYIESLINPRAGHIAGKETKVNLHNYITSINVLALTAAGRDSYKAVIKDATKFLKQLQWDEGEGKGRDSDFFGGAGYDSKSRPDLSNTQMFLDALIAAGISRDDPALKKAMVFVSRCQNLKSEWNDQAWAGKVNDGSFIYTAATGGATKVIDKPGPDGALPGYGSMTYAGIKSLIYCGASKDDDRIKQAFAWVSKNYTLDRNPGMPESRELWGLYYYYQTMAKCLHAMGVDTVTDARGSKRDWRAELTAELARRQRADGSWLNESDRWMEGNPHLVTGYALMALANGKPR